MKILLQILSLPFIALIKIYQWVISPWLGPKCRFTPTCSHYAAEALRRTFARPRGLGDHRGRGDPDAAVRRQVS